MTLNVLREWFAHLNLVLKANWRPWMSILLKFLVVYLFILTLCSSVVNIDFGWHLTSGNYYRLHGIPSHDIYTYTARNFPWINHEWANDVILSILYSSGGYVLVSAFYACIWTLAFIVRGLRVRLLFLLIAVAALMHFMDVRPLAWSFLFLALQLKILERKRRLNLLLVAALFLAWSNLHGGFVIGLVTIAYFLVKERRKYYLALFGVAVLATFINPYGPGIYVELFRTLSDSSLHNQVDEWQRFLIYPETLSFITLWWAGFIIFRRHTLSNWLGLGPLLFVAAMSASTNMPYFVIATLPDLEKYYKELRKEAPKKLSKGAKILLTSFSISLLLYSGCYYYMFLFPWSGREAMYPNLAVAYLSAHPCPGHLFNDYDYGGYLIRHLPSEPVYIDGRMPSWRDPSGQKYFDRYLAILENPMSRQKEFRQYNIRCVLVENTKKDIIDGLIKDRWKIETKSKTSILLEATKDSTN